ncbi:MAG: hypothetical protein Q9163_001016 [Psora crenata]
MVSSLQDIFLDFLYPVQTQALIKRLKRSTNAHQQAAQSLKQCSRNYTSIATGLIYSTVEGSDQLRQDHEADIATNEEQGGSQTRRIHELFNAQGSGSSCDALWQEYQDLLERSEVLSSQELLRMLRCLRASKSSTDAERLLALFESIPVHERRAIYYSYAISAALKLNDGGTAMYIHREALGRLHSPVGTSAILSHAVMQEDWKLAIATWHVFWSTGIGYYTRNDIWAGVEAMPLPTLMTKALAAADFAISEIGSPGSEDPSAARDFALEVIRRSFQVKNVAFSDKTWQRLQEKMRIFREHDAGLKTLPIDVLSIEQALSHIDATCRSAALDQYRDLRQRDADFVPGKLLLDSLLDRIAITRSTETMWMVIEDWRRHYGKLDIRVYHRIAKNLSRAGDTINVHKLFEAYCADHGKPRDTTLYNALLQAHHRRADPEEAVRVLDGLRKSHGFLPDVTSYNILIQAFARVGDVEGAMTWFEVLKESDMKPDSRSYFPLMLVYSKRGDRDTVLDLLQEANAEGIQPTKAMIDVVVLANANSGRLDEAEKLLEDALDMEFNGSRTHMWNIVLNAYALRKNLGEVTRLHRRMREAGVSSDSMTYAALLTSLAVAKQPWPAYKVLKKVMPQAGIQRSVLHYAIVMGGFLQTKSYEEVFIVYKDMFEQGLSPNISTQNVILRAAASVGGTSVSGATEGQADYARARQVLDQTIADLDPLELASSEPRKFVGPHRLDEAFTSSYFEYMIFLYGKKGAFQKVSEVYDQYIKIADRFRKRDTESPPPMRMLSALLVAHNRAGNNEEVDQCWYLALDKCESLARKANAKDLSEPNWVLLSRRFIINHPLQHYLDHLGEQSRFDEMNNVVNDLLRSGYDLTHRNWNTYIQYLAGSSSTPHLLLAFILTESKLMPHWLGWETMGRHPKMIKYRFKGMAKDMLKDPAKRAPTYLTFVRLTAAYVDLGFGRVKRKKEGVEELEASGRVRRTLDAVRNLPMIDDREQRTILNRGSSSS